MTAVKDNPNKTIPLPPVELLRKLIEHDGYKTGDQLPPERELALRLGIGRPAIREAIKALSILEVIESKPGAGTFIKSSSNMALNWPETMRTVKPKFDMLQLLEVRKMIEPQAAFLCATRATFVQLGELEQQIITQERNPNNRELMAKSDFLFHDVITRSAGNSILDDVAGFLSPLLVRSRQITASSAPELTRMAREHRAIFEAIRRSQPDLAARAMTEHLQSVGLDLLSAPEKISSH
ncbi:MULTISPECIES: FadR/GntR family transcriptional regulator [Acidobacteriaceae]|uniref:FadR/GntR family transcriptional regulator n=1 Tax=Acidobacteriaceae TaxID=204434 RepID=UPI00131C6D72|nr:MULTISPECIES: FadR/GntR family transcriptional regulator [Acidobacteriaceae]MDW5267715.1 FadR/GntR family transcriptional regulator [Edaphobacter sp.]